MMLRSTLLTGLIQTFGTLCTLPFRMYVGMTIALMVTLNFPLFSQELPRLEVRDPYTPFQFETFDTNAIGQQYLEAAAIFRKKPDSALLIYQDLLRQCQRYNYFYGIAKNVFAISLIYANTNPEKALLLLKSIYPMLVSRCSRLLPEYFVKAADFALTLGHTDTALLYSHMSLKAIGEQEDTTTNKLLLSRTYINLGGIYMRGDYRNFPLAIQYFEKAVSAARAGRTDSTGQQDLEKSLIGLGGAYANQNFYDSGRIGGFRKGLAYIHEVIAMADSNSVNLGQAYRNAGLIYIWLHKPDSAAFYIDRAMEEADEQALIADKISAYNALGAAYYAIKDFTKSEHAHLKALALCMDNHYRRDLLVTFKALSDVYILTKRYDQALIFLQQYSFLRDSLINEEKVRAITNLELKYRSAEKDKALAFQSLQLTRQQSQLREKNIWIGAVGFSSVFLAGLLLMGWRNIRHRKRLAEEQRQRWEQNEEIRSLKATVNGEERERARIGRELHDGIVGQLAVAKINFQMIQKKYPELSSDFREALSYLDETAGELRKTAHNLMPGILMDQGLIAAVHAFCEKTSTFTGVEIDVHQDGILPRLDIDFELSVYRMVQELVQNIIKHANATRALVQLDYHEPILILTVEDNGAGIADDQLASGMGLTNLKTRVKALQGRVDISGSPREGTSVYIEFDISRIKNPDEICL